MTPYSFKVYISRPVWFEFERIKTLKAIGCKVYDMLLGTEISMIAFYDKYHSVISMGQEDWKVKFYDMLLWFLCTNYIPRKLSWFQRHPLCSDLYWCILWYVSLLSVTCMITWFLWVDQIESSDSMMHHKWFYDEWNVFEHRKLDF